jgi:hypothetical protein
MNNEAVWITSTRAFHQHTPEFEKKCFALPGAELQHSTHQQSACRFDPQQTMLHWGLKQREMVLKQRLLCGAEKCEFQQGTQTKEKGQPQVTLAQVNCPP